MSGTHAISTTLRRAVIKFFFLQGKALKGIRAILTEALACFLPGRAKDLSAPLYYLSPACKSLFVYLCEYSKNSNHLMGPHTLRTLALYDRRTLWPGVVLFHFLLQLVWLTVHVKSFLCLPVLHCPHVKLWILYFDVYDFLTYRPSPITV